MRYPAITRDAVLESFPPKQTKGSGENGYEMRTDFFRASCSKSMGEIGDESQFLGLSFIVEGAGAAPAVLYHSE